MGNYRKFLEPAYGKVAPEVDILPPQILDMEDTERWRIRNERESVAGMTAAFQRCSCYEKIMGVRTENIICRFDGRDVPVRVYMPGGNSSYPVLVFYHGGSFSMNSIDVYDYVHRYLSYYGDLIVVAPDYHLAPEYKYPAGLNESYEALVWTAENIGRYGGDPGNITIGGDSSGGNFAAAVALMARDRKGPHVKGQVLYYPLTTNYEEEMTDSEKRYGKGYFLEYNCMENPMAVYFHTEEEAKEPLASPLLAESLEGLPEACFISAECDPLLDQGLQYAARLEDAGVAVEYYIYTGMIHGFINQTYGKSFEALNRAIDFIRRKDTE